MKEHFYDLADALTKLAGADEVITCAFEGEDSDFCRINHASVRQAGHVTQQTLNLQLIGNGRQTTAAINLTGVLADDVANCRTELAGMRQILPHLPEDPFLLYATDNQSSENCREADLPSSTEMVGEILSDAEGSDLVGIFAAGSIFSGFASSLGKRNWYASRTFNLDASIYVQADKAAKLGYAGFNWDRSEWRRRLAGGRHAAKMLEQPVKTLAPGKYRVYLAPEAMDEVFELLSWNAFSMKAQRTKQSALNWLAEERQHLHHAVHICEDIAGGMARNFDDAGFPRPAKTHLIQAGKMVSSLVSARSAREFDVMPGGANAYESPESLAMAPGKLAEENVLKTLDTGVLVNNLWYLNYSDMQACRMTGMTRFATFWVEKGEIVAPLAVMRFDESLYRMLGSQLEDLTDKASFIPSASTYERRSTVSRRLPGAMISQFEFTL